MSDRRVKTLNGGEATLGAGVVEAFASGLSGRVLTPGAEDYDDVRAIWNAMIDKRPGLIAQCASSADVVRAVELANAHDLLVAVRGAGHNIAGNSLCDGGLLIDLSTMKRVDMDPAGKTVRVDPGVTLGELDRATQADGLAVSVGINSTTGISGLTLGGGFGWLSRRWGMTIDNLVAATVVLASGEEVRASADSHPDLFWALRGGGGNFGIVTSFEFRLCPVGPEVLAGLVVHPFAAGKGALQFYREFTATAPDELTVWMVTRKAPPLPFLPEEVHGTEVIVFALVYSGEVAAGQAAVQPLLSYGKPHGTHVEPMPFVDFQAAFDPLLGPGARNYWKSHNFAEFSDGLIDTVLGYAGSLPNASSEIFIAHVGGAQARVAPDATAYWHRDANYVMNVHTRWEDAADDDRCIAWARQFFAASSGFATGGVYVNFMPEDETDRVGAAYGGNYDRLAAIKARYDPANRFRLNHNIAPARQ
jgi:FAD/FMN-containing dehydrogenase